jgi:hypothetical protein
MNAVTRQTARLHDLSDDKVITTSNKPCLLFYHAGKAVHHAAAALAQRGCVEEKPGGGRPRVAHTQGVDWIVPRSLGWVPEFLHQTFMEQRGKKIDYQTPFSGL